MWHNGSMRDLIDTVQDHLPAIAEARTKPKDAEVIDIEDMVSHSMFEYYTKIYHEYPDWNRAQYVQNVADKFGVPTADIDAKYQKYRWFSRAKKAILEGKSGTMLPKDATEALDQMLINTNLIATLGTRFITDYLKEANPLLMTPKDVHKIGMLVVECVRITNEVKGGAAPGQAQGQVINFVINE